MPAHKAFLALSLAAITTFATAQDQPIPRPDASRPGAPAAGDRRADVMGRVTAVSPDGRSLTIAAPPRPTAEGQPPARPEPTTVLLSDRTQFLFFGVSDGQATPAPGMMAMVWLEEGSKDQAARIRLMKREGEDRPDVQGRVVAVSTDARTITVETRDPDDRTGLDRPAGKIDLHIAPYTQSLYYGVDKNGARPTPDYQVVAWLEKGSKDTPARIRFMKNEPRDFPPTPLPAPRP